MTSERVPNKGVILGGGADSLPLEQLSLDSRAVAAIATPSGPTPSWPVTPPICHAVTYRMKGCDDFLALLSEGGAIYSRLGNETSASTEAAINALEGGAGSLVFASGMAAVTTVLMAFLKSGDHLVANRPMYSGTFAFLKAFCSKFGVELSFVRSGCDVEEYRKLVKPNTKMLYGETPCNPAMEITDLEAFGKLGQSLEGVVTVIDSTFGSPYLQQPIRHGVDISLHSCTKYMGGHSDLMGGCVTTRTLDQWRLIRKWSASLMGNVLSPPDCSLLLRSLRTLPVRMLRHSENALKVATFLEKHPKVIRVAYPGLPSHPGHKVAARQMRAFGGMIMAEVKGGSKGGQLVAESMKLVTLAVSLGGVMSLIEHPHSMTHGPYLMAPEETKDAGITEGMLRISIGLEDPDDLIKDFQQALDKIPV